jgi:hypothetical protein
MFRYVSLVTFGLLLSANAVMAQTQNPAPAPAPAAEPSDQEKMEDPQVGDHWTYEYRDEITGDVKSIITNTVTDLSDSQIGIRITWAGRSNSNAQTFDRSWNLINNGVRRYSPNDGSGIQAPLAVGKAWHVKSNEINSTSGFVAKRSGTSKVTAQESVTTPAGTFDTLKIETSYLIQNSNNVTDKAQVVMQTWYAPTVDHWVKRSYTMRYHGRVTANNAVELVDYGRR